MLRHKDESMGRSLLVAAIVAISASLVGCVTPAVKEYTGPSGVATKQVKCNTSSDGCMQHASASCSNGPYQVVSSESHAGGLLSDQLVGPVTWYSMTYICGQSDGTTPTFPFNGQQYAPPPVVIQQPAQPVGPTRIDCYQTGNYTSCTAR